MPLRPLPPAEPPRSEEELLARAEAVAGLSFAQVATELGVPVPPDLRRAKGFPGQLAERVLGATAKSRAEPDFPELGVELKTLPVDAAGRPLESTFVCTIALLEMEGAEWRGSRAQRKLARVLWWPIDGRREVPVADRRFGAPLLWSPSEEEEAVLVADWTELAGMVGRGDTERITGHLGRALQVRPKAANALSRRRGLERDGVPYAALPRGFYLRASFTEAILRRHFRS